MLALTHRIPKALKRISTSRKSVCFSKYAIWSMESNYDTIALYRIIGVLRNIYEKSNVDISTGVGAHGSLSGIAQSCRSVASKQHRNCPQRHQCRDVRPFFHTRIPAVYKRKDSRSFQRSQESTRSSQSRRRRNKANARWLSKDRPRSPYTKSDPRKDHHAQRRVLWGRESRMGAQRFSGSDGIYLCCLFPGQYPVLSDREQPQRLPSMGFGRFIKSAFRQ